VKTIQACIFVVKFSAKIDDQYKYTIQYYSKLLPSLFEGNVVIVVTDFATDERSVSKRHIQGTDVEAVTNNITREIVVSSGISYCPMLFSIDCVPFGEGELKTNKQNRDAILSYVFSLKKVNLNDLQVAKTKSIEDSDKKAIRLLEGEIVGYSERLKQANIQAKDALDMTLRKEKRITDLDAELTPLKESLQEKDMDTPIVAKTWSVRKWSPFQTTREFELEIEWDIVNVDRWTNGHCTWSNFVKERKKVSGMVESKFMHVLYACIKVETSKRLMFEKEIAELKSKIEVRESERRLIKERAEESRKQYEKFAQDIDLLEEYIAERREKVKELSKLRMPLEEAHVRLRQLCEPK